MKTNMKKFTSLTDLYDRCEAGDQDAQRVCIGTLLNLGCDHLATPGSPITKNDPKWLLYYRGLLRYIDSLVGEYGLSEVEAFREVLKEVNSIRGYCDDISL